MPTEHSFFFSWCNLFVVVVYLFSAALGLCCLAVSSCGEWGLFCRCGAQASHCDGFSCRRAQAPGHAGFSSCGTRVQ